MVPGFLIALREGLEAALIIGVTLGVLSKAGQDQYRKWVWFGAGAAALLSVIVAAFLQAIGATLEGTAEEIFEGTTMLLAAGVLTWMIFWMYRQSHQYQQTITRGVEQAASHSQRWGLFGIAFFAVLREGIETALFLTATALTPNGEQAFLGGLAGLIVAGLLGWALFASAIRLNVQRFFQITSLLLILFAAGLFAHGVHEFVEVGWIPAVIDPVWNINSILDE
jgi:high-affinity iron transporter